MLDRRTLVLDEAHIRVLERMQEAFQRVLTPDVVAAKMKDQGPRVSLEEISLSLEDILDKWNKASRERAYPHRAAYGTSQSISRAAEQTLRAARKSILDGDLETAVRHLDQILGPDGHDLGTSG
jgi:hypothetical protein